MALDESISLTVWKNKYQYRQEDRIRDVSIEDTWQRVAKAIAYAEKKTERKHWQAEFYRILENYQFLPGGRILAGAGTRHKVTLLNCFVMDIAEDSLPSIFHALEEAALTLQQGGGVGYDFSVLRPNGSWVKKTGIPSSGPISFMRIWDAMCSVLLSTGTRRGAMMGVMRCDHPDIEEFITAKENPSELRHFNVSVLITDAFMQAVKQDADWPLVFANKIYRKVSARNLWNKIIRSAYDYAEPGVLFIDTINRKNNLWYCEKIYATNPCGEIPLPAYGACDLGSINLTQFVSSPFSPNAQIEWHALENVASIATRFLDNVIDVSRYPLPSQRLQSLGARRIGLGVTGLADVLVMLGMRYGSAASLSLTQEMMKHIAETTWQTSIELAKEKNPFPFYSKKYLQGEFVQSLNSSIQKDLKKVGVRNSHHNTIAPTGTISLLANNVSNGIEPIFRAEYDRHVRTINEETMTFRVKDYAFHQWQEKNNNHKLPPEWVDTESLEPHAHLQMQAVAQKYIDNAISKTINIPHNFPFEKLESVYTEAYHLGLKGCTVFRPNPITGNVLEVPEEHCCQFDAEDSIK